MAEKTNEKELENLIRANARVIQIISYETLRVHALLVNSAKTLGRELYKWHHIDGIQKWDFEKRMFVPENTDARAPDQAFDFFREKEKLILLLEDFHPNLTEHQPDQIKRIRNAAFSQVPEKTLVLSQPFRRLPPELEKEVHIMEIPYPDRGEVTTIYKKVCLDQGIPLEKVPAPDNELIDAALGLTIMEAEKAFSLAYIEDGKLSKAQVPLVIREKENVIKKSGHLEYYHAEEKIEDVGGLDNLTGWLKKRGKGFDKEAKDFGLDYPKGIMLLGVPGTGKSLTAKAIANLWHFPLLKLDMGKIFGGIVGESERNIREALNIAEAISPSILFIDEIEKGLSGSASSGQTDGGTTSRVLGTFLSWMQDKKKPVFVVATANNIDALPPELLRKGRVDEIFFVDLPTEVEREAILAIHLRKKKQDPARFDCKKIAEAARGFSGAELEEAVKEALFQAYDDNKRQAVDDDILQAIKMTSPLSWTRHDEIKDMRKWAQQGRAVAASLQPPEALDEEKSKQGPKLKSEASNNPFIK